MDARRRQPLPPLDPELYLAWLWRKEGRKGKPITVSDFAFAMGLDSDVARRAVLWSAAFARRCARLEAKGYDLRPLRQAADEMLLQAMRGN